MAQADNPVICSFRPHLDVEGDYFAIKKWCVDNGYAFNSVFSSFLPAIAYAIQNQSYVAADGERYIRADFGDVLLRTKKYAININNRHHANL